MANAEVTKILSNRIKLSHKQYRAQLKKTKRKQKRKQIAQERDEKIRKELMKLESSPGYLHRKEREEKEEQILQEHEEREMRRLHYLWLKREEEAMVQFRKKQEQAERVRAQKEEEARKAREDFEKLQHKEIDEKKSKEDALKEVIHNLPEGNEPWHNPIAPPRPEVQDIREICHFYSKTGACRFGDRCSRKHDRPETSQTILLRGMFTHFCMEEMFHDEYDTDIGLEFEDNDMYQYFLDFYEDVVPEFKKIGRVMQFKVCCNQEQHLRGNVYVQYEKESEAEQAIRVFNGRFYGGKQLSCEYTCVTKWKSAICGLFNVKRCPKGRTCNFLHVFNNPKCEFRQADYDIFESDNDRTRSHRSLRNHGLYSSRSDKHYSSSRRSRRSHSKQPSSRSRHSRSKSPSIRSRRSCSKTPLSRSRHSRSNTPTIRSRQSRSKSPPIRSRRLRSKTPNRSRRSRSKTPNRSRRLRSKSPLIRSKRSHSKTPLMRLKRSRTKSPLIRSRLSRSKSPPLKRLKHSRSNSPCLKSSHSCSKTPSPRLRHCSKSPSFRSKRSCSKSPSNRYKRRKHSKISSTKNKRGKSKSDKRKKRTLSTSSSGVDNTTSDESQRKLSPDVEWVEKLPSR